VEHDPQASRRRDHRGTAVTAPTGQTASPSPPELALQRRAGNRAVADLIEGAQAKLAVGSVDDPLEHEADAVAAEVVDAVRTGSVTAATARRGIARRRPESAGGAAAAPDGPDGGPVDPGVEARVRSGRGGRPLPSSTREPLEQAFGNADFSGVRVHAGPDAADLNDRVGAEAFTVGADIFFRDGVPDATDPLLAHELTHVVQQGQAAPADGDAHRSHDHDAIQRFRNPFKKRDKAAPVEGGKHDAALSTADVDPSNAVKVPKMTAAYPLKGDTVLTAATTTVIRPGTEIVVDYGRSLRKRAANDDPTAPPGYVPIRTGIGGTGEDLAGRYIRLSAIDGTAAADGPKAGIDKAVTVGSKLGDLFGTVSDVSGEADDAADNITTGKANEAWQDNLAGRSDGLAYASGAGDIAGMFVTLASSIRTFQDTEADNWEKGEAGIDAVQALGSGAGGIAGIVDTATDSAGKSAEASGGLGMFTGIFDGIKATFTVVKKAIHLAKDASKHEMTNQEKFHDVMEIVTGLLEAAKSGLETAKTFLDTFASGPSAALTNSIPGFGIAIGAADLIVRSVDLIYAKIHSNAMRKEKRSLKELLGGEKGKSSKALATTRMQEIDAKRGTGDDVSADEEMEYDRASEYLLAKGVQYVNDKRINRAVLKMSVAMTKASGDVATLGGASAPVGIGLKAGAMALDVGASAFRTFKQWARDKKAAREEKQGSQVTTGFFSLFNSDKSSAAKWKKYNRMVDKIYDMILAADSLPAATPDTRFKKIDKYVRAMGMRPSKMYSLRGDPAKLRLEMITAMKERE
jgi:hypothetical protein